MVLSEEELKSPEALPIAPDTDQIDQLDELRQMVDFGFEVDDTPRQKKATEASEKKAA